MLTYINIYLYNRHTENMHEYILCVPVLCWLLAWFLDKWKYIRQSLCPCKDLFISKVKYSQK